MANTAEQGPQVSEKTQANLSRIGHEALSLTMAENLAQLRHAQETELAQSERTHELTELISVSLAEAYDALVAEQPGQVVLHDVLLEKALELQRKSILDRQKSGELAQSDLEAYLATYGLTLMELDHIEFKTGGGWSWEQETQKVKDQALDELLAAGMAEQLVEASRRVYGVVVNKSLPGAYLDDFGFDRTIELSHLLDLDVLSAGLGKKVSVDPAEAAFSELRDAELSDLIDKLGLKESARAALIARTQMSKPHAEGPKATKRRDLSSLHALDLILKSQTDIMDARYYFETDETIAAIELLAKANPALGKQIGEDIFRGIRSGRQMGEHYRNNSQHHMRLDRVIADILENKEGEYGQDVQQIVRRMMPDEEVAKQIIAEGHAVEILDVLPYFTRLSSETLSEAVFPRIRQGYGIEGFVWAMENAPDQPFDYDQIFEWIRQRDPNDEAYFLAYVFTYGTEIATGESKLLTDLAQLREQIQNETSLFEIFGPNGAGASFGQSIWTEVFKDTDNPLARAKMLDTIFSRDQSFWYLAWQIANIKLGEVEEIGYQSELKIMEVPTSLPASTLKNGTLLHQYEQLRPTKISDMDVEEKRLFLGLGTELSDEEIEALTANGEIDFDKLSASVKSTIFAHRLMETVVLSRSVKYKEISTERNRKRAESEEWWRVGDLVHATKTPAQLRQILQSGALCGEAIGMAAARDSYPMNLDTVVIEPEVEGLDSHVRKLATLDNPTYGDICLVFGRGTGALHDGEDFTGGWGEVHRLVLGGLPSTEISEVLLRGSPEPEFIDQVKAAIIDSGIYIPIIGPNGDLILPYEDYVAARADKNYDAVEVEVKDSTFRRAESQGGSNEGAEFLVNGTERWYVKFAQEDPDHIWGEILTDHLYGMVHPDLVAETEPVIIEGRLARASKMVEVDDGPVSSEARNAGFILDCWLANWDAVYNSANLVNSGGRALRVDNGNGLFFRAQGERVTYDDFGAVVKEIETGTDDSRLGDGMRQKYPDLTDEEIRTQVEELRARATDERIDEQVDSARLSSADREFLKRRLKERRDYLVTRFLS